MTERDDYQKELVDRCAPRWAWEIIDDVLEGVSDDSHSNSMGFGEHEQREAREALDAMLAACEKGE